MKKNIIWIIGLFVMVASVVSSCDETDGAADPYTDWQNRNQAYIDSIAQVARTNPGQWKVIHTYKFVPTVGDLNVDVNDYVYCKVLEEGTGEISPFYTDSVSTHYRGKLIPLYNGEEVVFDQSFRGKLDKDVAVPVTFSVGGVIEGWTTALQQMKEGDRWEIYVPSDLAYGDYAYDVIPGFSTLIFDISLEKVITNR